MRMASCPGGWGHIGGLVHEPSYSYSDKCLDIGVKTCLWRHLAVDLHTLAHIHFLLHQSLVCKFQVKNADAQETCWVCAKQNMLGAGFCDAAVEALRWQGTELQQEMVGMLVMFFQSLSQGFHSYAMEVLVEGNAVENILEQMSEAGVDILGDGLSILMIFSANPGACGRLCVQAHNLIKGIDTGIHEVMVLLPLILAPVLHISAQCTVTYHSLH
jgi:hypothetical protein